jgi:Cysteine rich repeat
MRKPFLLALALVAMCLLPWQLVKPAHAQTQTQSEMTTQAIGKEAVARAEDAVAKIKTACNDDLTKYCSTVTPGEGRLALCMMAHEDKVSGQCYGAIFDVADGIELAISKVRRAADACGTDVNKICGNVNPGEGRIARCMVDNKSQLSPGCRTAFADFESRMNR